METFSLDQRKCNIFLRAIRADSDLPYQVIACSICNKFRYMLGTIKYPSTLVTLQIVNIAMANTFGLSPRLITIHVNKYLHVFQTSQKVLKNLLNKQKTVLDIVQ